MLCGAFLYTRYPSWTGQHSGEKIHFKMGLHVYPSKQHADRGCENERVVNGKRTCFIFSVKVFSCQQDS